MPSTALLQDRVAIVTGASSGIGRAIARRYAAEGAAVVVADRIGSPLEGGDSTQDLIRAEGGTALFVEADIADWAAVDALVARTVAEFGRLDVIVNNTGGPPPTPVAGQEAETWQRFFSSMVLPVIAITDRVLPAMKEAGWGRIITSASSGVIAPIPNLGVSNTLRGSLLGWSKTLAQEVGRDGITANVIVPGRIATRRITFLDEQKAKREGRPVAEVAAQSTASIPLGRYGRPEEYGDVAAFLASERASYITGSVIRVDGGLIPSI